jgi:hypothetical protein
MSKYVLLAVTSICVAESDTCEVCRSQNLSYSKVFSLYFVIKLPFFVQMLILHCVLYRYSHHVM